MAFQERHLYIKKSKLPGSGKGLFTKKPIKKGTRIVAYKGKLQAWKEVRKEDGYNGYLLKVSAHKAINALHSNTFGRYANDAKGINKVVGLGNNAEYVVDGNRCYLDATHDIGRWEEILVGYGDEYWKLIRSIRRRQKQGNKPS